MNVRGYSRHLAQLFSLIWLFVFIFSQSGTYVVSAQGPIEDNQPSFFVTAAPVIAQGESVNVIMSQDGVPVPFELKLDIDQVESQTNLTWGVKSQAGHGNAQVEPLGESVKVTYLPAPSYTGKDAFVVQVINDQMQTDEILVKVTVISANQIVLSKPKSTNSDRPELFSDHRNDLENRTTQLTQDHNKGYESNLQPAFTPSVGVEAVAALPYFYVYLVENNIYGYYWLPGVAISLMIDDPSNGVGVDYSESKTSDGNGYVTFNTSAYPLEVGQLISMTDGSTTKTLTITSLSIGDINATADSVSGTAEPASTVGVTAFGTEGYGNREVITDSIGNWLADFSTGSNIIDLVPGTYGWASQNDEDGEGLAVYWYVPNPTISVNFVNDFVTGWGWPLGANISLTIDDLGNGVGTDFSDTVTVIEDSWGNKYFNLQVNYDIKPGQIVTATDGIDTRSHTVRNIAITSIDESFDFVQGTAEPGAELEIYACNYDCKYVYPIADGVGSWVADFSGLVDIKPGSNGYLNEYDSQRNRTELGWYVSNPGIYANITRNTIYGSQWLPGVSISLTIDDPTNGVGVDYSISKDSDVSGWLYIDMSAYPLKPGQLITMTDGRSTKALTLTNLTIKNVDPATDTVSGTAEPASSVNVASCSNNNSCYYREAITAADGNWLADFSTGPNSTDIIPGSTGSAYQSDEDGDETLIDWYIPNPTIEAYVTTNTVFGYQWLPGVSISLTIDDPSTGVGVDFSVSKDSDVNGWLYIDVSAYPLKAGQLITMTDGRDTKVLTLTSLTIENVDPATDTVSGTAEPASSVNVVTCNNNHCYLREVITAVDGNWLADFSVGSESIDIIPGSIGWARQSEKDGDSTVADWFVPDPTILANVTANLVSGSRWSPETSINMTIDDPANGVGVDFSTSGNSDAGGWIDFFTTHYLLKVGQLITMTDGVFTRSMTISNLSITNIDLATDIVTGTATPGLEGWINTWAGTNSCRVVLDIGQDGQWIANSFQACGLENGSFLNVYQEDSNRNLTEVYFQILLPTIASISPFSALKNSPEFTLTVNGSGFGESSIVQWNGENRPTTFIGPNQLTALISSADLSTIGTAMVKVVTPIITDAVSSEFSFTIKGAPGAFNKLTPAKASTGLSGSPTLSWSTSSGATTYYYCYDTTNDNGCSTWISNGSSTTKTLSGLAPNTTYYWQVRAVNADGTTYANGYYSAFFSFTTSASVAPASFNKLTPAKASTGLSGSPTLNWSSSSGATTYYYCYDTTNDNGCSSWISNGSSTTKTLSGLAPNTTYYWQVRAVNAGGTTYANGYYSAFFSFTTSASVAPASFNKLTPAKASTGLSGSPTLSWSSSSGATTYYYCYDTTNDNGCSSWISNGSSTTKTLSGLAPNTTYYWQVRAVNAGGTTYANGYYSAFFSFTTSASVAPASFNKLTPAKASTGLSGSPTLSWSSSSGVSTYYYCIDATNDNGCSNWISNGSSTTKTLTGLAPNTTYYWQVRAVNPDGTTYANGYYSAFWAFSTSN